MTEQPSDRVSNEERIDGLLPEEWSHRQARRAFIFALLTPVWWVAMLILINILAGVFPSTTADSTFVFALWGFTALVFTGTATYTGIQQIRLIREYDERKGLGLARGALIIGAVFTIVSVIIIVVIFTSVEAGTRPLF